MELKYEYTDVPGGVEVALKGELMFYDSQTFMQQLPMMVQGKGGTISFNMEQLSFIDSSGLGAILYVSEALRMQGQKLVIQKPNVNVKKLLKVIQNVGTFTIVGEE